MNDVEARSAGGELDDCLLPLLLFRNQFGFDLDAGEVGKFGGIFL